MPRQRQAEITEATRRKIKAIAHQLMAEQGTAGLSLRAIARAMAMTAPALYHYYASLDELITALIVDAFTGHAAYVRQARDQTAAAGKPYGEQLLAAVQAFRQWALAHPLDFQLIYGNPIPGYHGPQEVTTPAARAIGLVFLEPLLAGVQAGAFTLAPAYRHIPPTVQAHYQTKYGMAETTAQVFHVMNHVWGLMHGLVALEIYNHAQPVVGDTDAFYEQAIRQHLAALGIAVT